jgi:hypothetical protein
VRTAAGNARLFNATELLVVPDPNTVSHITDKQAATLNDVPFEEITEKEDEPVVDKPLPPPKPEKTPLEFTSSAQWRKALVGKTFMDAERVHGEVTDVDYSKGYRVHYGKIKKKGSNGKYLAKDQYYQSLVDFLDDAQSEPWFTPDYAEVMDKLKK